MASVVFGEEVGEAGLGFCKQGCFVALRGRCGVVRLCQGGVRVGVLCT